MEWYTILGCIFGGWTILRIVGSERQRRMDLIAHKARQAEETARQEAETLPIVS